MVLKHQKHLGVLTFEEFLKNDNIFQKIIKFEIEGYVLTTKQSCVKFKNIVENDNSLYFIQQRVEEYKTRLRDIEISIHEKQAKELQSNIAILEQMAIYYNSNPEFANKQILENLVVQLINKGLITEVVTLSNKKKWTNIICKHVLNELKEINMTSDTRNINGVIGIKFKEMNILR